MDTIRWGIIGTGDVAEQKGGPALYGADGSELVSVANRTRSRAESFATRHGNPKVCGSIAELLEDSNVDAVYVATPPSSHAELTEKAALAGKHVLCEKPMAGSVAECERMIEVCKQNNVSLAIAFYRRYFPVVQKMKELLEAGAVGKPLRVSATTISLFQSNEKDPWRLNQSVGGGGFLMDVGSHRFDLMTYLVGAAKRVTGVVGTQQLVSTVEDAASIAMEFEDGVQGSAAFHWNCPVSRDTLEIVGSQGILSIDSLSDKGLLALETGTSTERWRLPASAPVHLNLVQHFVDHLLEGKPNPLPGESGMLATSIAQAVYEADASHK